LLPQSPESLLVRSGIGFSAGLALCVLVRRVSDLVSLICMRFSLRLSRFDNSADYSVGKRFRFAVVDLDKAKDYPLNFVCMLPSQLSPKGKGVSVFVNVFGDRSLEMAKGLLLDALEMESDVEVRAELGRRLKLLEPKAVDQKKCDACGNLFQPRRSKRFKQRFCQECVKKKFGSRE